MGEGLSGLQQEAGMPHSLKSADICLHASILRSNFLLYSYKYIDSQVYGRKPSYKSEKIFLTSYMSRRIRKVKFSMQSKAELHSSELTRFWGFRM